MTQGLSCFVRCRGAPAGAPFPPTAPNLFSHLGAHGRRRALFGKSHLMTTGHKLATTDAGALDVLGSINDGLLYDDLIGSSDELEVTGQRVKVLSLRRLVELKRALARPKDLAMLPVLEATLRERESARES